MFLLTELSFPGLSEGDKLNNNTAPLSDWWVPNSSRYRSGLFRTCAGSIPHWARGGGGCGTRDVLRPAAGGQETAEGDAGVFSTAMSGGEESHCCYESHNERLMNVHTFPVQFCCVDNATKGLFFLPQPLLETRCSVFWNVAGSFSLERRHSLPLNFYHISIILH